VLDGSTEQFIGYRTAPWWLKNARTLQLSINLHLPTGSALVWKGKVVEGEVHMFLLVDSTMWWAQGCLLVFVRSCAVARLALQRFAWMLMTPQIERVPADSCVGTTGDAEDDTIEAPVKLRCVAKAAHAVDISPNSGDVDAVVEPCDCMCCQLGYFPIDPVPTPTQDTPSSEPPASIEVLGGQVST
jgi:hypothetical protein